MDDTKQDSLVSYSVFMPRDQLTELQQFHAKTPREVGSFQEFLRRCLEIGLKHYTAKNDA